MKEILETIIKNLVEFPEQISITEKIGERGAILEVRVASSDMGKVIGREGQIAKSIRSIVKAIASKEQKKVSVEFVD